MSHNNRKRVPCANRCGNVTRSTSGECRDCLLKPREAPAESFPPEQQGAWTEAGKERRKAELDRRRQQLAPLSLDATAEIETAMDVDPDADVRSWYDAIPTMGNGHKWIFTFDELAESAKATARADYLSIRALTPAPDVDADAEVKAYRERRNMEDGFGDVPWEHCFKDWWRADYAAHKARESSAPTLPRPEPANVALGATSQAVDTLAVTHAWASDPETVIHAYETEQEPSRLVFGLWCAIAGAAAVCVAVVCLQAAGVL